MSSSEYQIIANIVAGIEVPDEHIASMPALSRKVAQQVITSNGSSKAKAFTAALADLIPDKAKRDKYRKAVFACSPTAAQVAEQNDTPPETSFHLTDLGNAERLAAQHGAELKYVAARGWLVWGGKRWEASEPKARRRAKQTVRRIYGEAERCPDDKERKAIATWATRSEGEGRIRAMLSLAESEIAIDAKLSDFDVDTWLFNCGNGTLDLRTGKLRPHSPNDKLTRLAGTTYDPAATCPRWTAFLERIFDGNANLINFMRRAVGYTLTGNTSEQCLFMPWGAGRNGKSTFIDTLHSLFGDYGQQAEFSAFLAKQNETVRNDLARMVGARFVGAAESGEGRRLAENLIKQATGGDVITARFLFKEYFEYKPAFKLWLATNHKPVIKGTDLAIWRRIRLIPFTVTIPEKEQDKKLPAKLLDELPGILTWAVAGCREWLHDGLGVPDEVKEATAAYKAEQDSLAGFLRECCDLSGEATTGALLNAYVGYSGEKGMTAKKFGDLLREAGFKSRHSMAGTVWGGISLPNLLPKEGNY